MRTYILTSSLVCFIIFQSWLSIHIFQQLYPTYFAYIERLLVPWIHHQPIVSTSLNKIQINLRLSNSSVIYSNNLYLPHWSPLLVIWSKTFLPILIALHCAILNRHRISKDACRYSKLFVAINFLPSIWSRYARTLLHSLKLIVTMSLRRNTASRSLDS